MALWARQVSDGIQLLRDPDDTTGLLPVDEITPDLLDSQTLGGYTLDVQPDRVVLTWEAVDAAPPDPLSVLQRQIAVLTEQLAVANSLAHVRQAAQQAADAG